MNQPKKNPNQEIIVVPDRIQVFEDPRTRAKTVAFPFQFPDGVNGLVMVSRLNRFPWRPADILQEITLTFKVH